MKNNSHNNKSSFGLIFSLIALLVIGITFGRDAFLGTLMCIVIVKVTIFILGVAIVLIETIKEEISERKKEKEEEAHSN